MRRLFLAVAVGVLVAAEAAGAAAEPQIRARGDPRTLFSYEDYPAAAPQRKEQGTVRAELTIGADGRVKACRVVDSSNSEALDNATCSILTRRARFTPARDANGNPVEDIYYTPPIVWRLVDTPVALMQQVQPGRYRCAPTAAANSLYQEILPLRPGEEMRVGFRLINENPASDYPATAAVVFEIPQGMASVAVGRAVNDPFAMFAALNLPGKPERLLYRFPLTKNWIILRFTLDGRGYLRIRSNDLEPKFPMGTTSVSRTAVYCNSGEWEIDVWPRSYLPRSAGAGATAGD